MFRCSYADGIVLEYSFVCLRQTLIILIFVLTILGHKTPEFAEMRRFILKHILMMLINRLIIDTNKSDCLQQYFRYDC